MTVCRLDEKGKKRKSRSRKKKKKKKEVMEKKGKKITNENA